jgi:diphthamide biosynthesis methyltransferase
MLYLIGLGLSDETDITVKGLEIVRKASRVYLEAYTSILLVDKAVLVGAPMRQTPQRELTLMYSRRNTMAEK